MITFVFCMIFALVGTGASMYQILRSNEQTPNQGTYDPHVWVIRL